MNYSSTLGCGMSISEVWKRIVQQIEADPRCAEIRRFMAHLEAVGFKDGTLKLETQVEAIARLVEDQFLALVREKAEVVLGPIAGIYIHRTTSAQRELFPDLGALGPKAIDAPSSTGSAGVRAAETGLSQQYTFDTFVNGTTTQFAHAASLAVAQQLGSRYNPLYIYGPTGCGKTHLLHAIGNFVRNQYPSWRIRYATADTFMTELVTALRKERIESFKQRYRSLDLLLLDDVQSLAGRERTQEELFHVFNTLYDQGKQIVLAATEPPQTIDKLGERLRNRFQWGLVADLQLPDLETRVAILEALAERENIVVSHEVAVYLATHVQGSVRELQGSLIRLAAIASLEKREMDLSLASQVVELYVPSQAPPLSIDRIQQVVAEFFGIRPLELRSKRRDRAVTVPRQIAMYLCRQHLRASFPAIGERFGRRDHTTVIHAVETVERKRREERSIRNVLEQLEQRLFHLQPKM